MNPHMKSVNSDRISAVDFVETLHRFIRAKRELLFLISELEKWSSQPSLAFPTSKNGWKIVKEEKETWVLPNVRVE